MYFIVLNKGNKPSEDRSNMSHATLHGGNTGRGSIPNTPHIWKNRLNGI